MPAVGATEEPHFALIGSTELAEPPERKVILAFGTFYLDRGHGFYFIVFIVYYDDLILRTCFPGLHLVGCFNLPDITTLPAF